VAKRSFMKQRGQRVIGCSKARGPTFRTRLTPVKKC
jgi:hypothetical protein